MDSRLFDLYFDARTANCTDCGAQIDFWTAMCDTIGRNFALTQTYAVIGAKQTSFTFELKAQQHLEIVFAEQGIPKDATILSINYTSGGSEVVFPVELHGNTPKWTAPLERISLYGIYRGDQPSARSEVHCMITWFLAPTIDNGWQYLVDAFREYSAGQWRNAVIPANVAAESALFLAAFQGLQACRLELPTKEFEEFLVNKASYAYQVKLLLPLLADIKGIPRMPRPIISKLNQLRNARNDLAHRGVTKQELRQDTVAELLAAATFGFRYAHFFRERLGVETKNEGK